jgi:hypothetical protein
MLACRATWTLRRLELRGQPAEECLMGAERVVILSANAILGRGLIASALTTK